jgi:hypothetical protein
MFKKLTYGLFLIFVVFVFTQCYQDHYLYLPANTCPVFKQGDTLVYTNEAGKKTAFQVTSFDHIYLQDGADPYYFENVRYQMDILDNSDKDTIGFNGIYTTEEASTYAFRDMNYLKLRLTRSNGIETLWVKYAGDTVFQNMSIGGKDYTSVYFYSLKNSETHCSNLYYSFQYGILSIEINNHLIYLSEIRPKR